MRDLSLKRRVAFIGASSFGLRCLRELEQLAVCEVVGIVTAPRRFTISYAPQGVTNVLHADFESFAAQRAIACVTMTGTMSDPSLLAAARTWRPELFVVVGWYHLLPRALRELAPAIGLHASLLPDYCGGAPLVWAIINGEQRTGITLFQLEDGVDDGPVYAQAEEPISDSDTIATLYARIESQGVGLLRRELAQILDGTARPVPQDTSRRRVFPQRKPADGRIDWTWPARRVYDFIRAQTRPYPGAYAMYRGEQVHIWRARMSEVGTGLRRACGDGRLIELEEVEYRGATLTGAELLACLDTEDGDATQRLV